jgi:hypothetical protein
VRTFFASLMLVLFAGAASAQIFTPEYKGHDKGYLVISVGGSRNPRDMTFAPIVLFYRSTDADNSRHGSVRYARPDWWNPMTQRPDYRDNDESGVVEVRALEPGHYEFHSFLAHQPGHDYDANFSIPFTIRPGEITYVGDYKFVEMRGEGAEEVASAKESYFVVRNRSRRDLAIAHLKEEHPQGPVNVQIADFSMVRSPFFRPDRQAELSR